MTASSGYLEAIREALAGLGPTTVKRMFGGAGIWADGVMFALIIDDVLHLKADERTRGAFEAKGLGPFSYAKKTGQVAVMSYWRAPERLIDDPDEMVAWARTALRVAKDKAAQKVARAAVSRRGVAKTKTGRTSAARRKHGN